MVCTNTTQADENKNPCQRQDLRGVLDKRLVHLLKTGYQYRISEPGLAC